MEENKMKEFSIGDIPPSGQRKMEQELVGGLKVSSCEFMAKIKGLERDEKPQKDLRIAIEEVGTEDIPKWRLDH